MTPILKVITEYCSIYVDDINLQSLAEEDTPLYARRIWGYFRPAITLFTIPARMPLYLLGTPENPKLTEPIYGSTQYTVDEDETADFTVNLGEGGKGYELFCCRLRTFDDFGNVVMQSMGAPIYKTITVTPEPIENENGETETPEPYEVTTITMGIATYNPTDGTVTFTASEENPIPKGTIFDMDFYTDGYFTETLSPEIMNILGMCFQVVWQTRFINDWLSNVSKVEDKSFYEQNRANKIKADDERFNLLKTTLAGAMRRFEQNLATRKMFPFGSLI